MPVKRRIDKRRAAGFDAWEPPLLLGFDVLNTLYMAGVPVNDDLRFDREAARAAWRQHGAELLDRWGADDAARSWALEEFGEP